MNSLAIGIDFVKLAGEEQRTIHARIECPVLVQITAINLNLAQHLVPSRLAFFLQRIEIVIAQFFHVQFSLVVADERRSDAGVDNLAFLRLETDDGSGMVGILFQFVLRNLRVAYHSLVCKRLVKLYNKIILEVIRHTTAVLCRVTDNLVFFRDNLHIRTLVEGIQHHVRVFTFREGKAEHHGALCRRQFRYDVILGQIYLIIIRLRDFALVGKPAGTPLHVELRTANHRHNSKLSVIVNPRTRLVRLLETVDFRRCVLIHPAVAHLASLRRPEVHTPRTCGCRIRITR